MPLFLVEIVCCSVADALATTEGGAHRIELCTALELGGLTPSLGLLEAVKACSPLPVMAMIRPRPGGFCYAPDELAVMERDAQMLLTHGADGLVVGALTEQGTLDAAACRRLLDSADGKPVTFHRAFDMTPDLSDSLETLVALGFSRILTSGGAETSLSGVETLTALNRQTAGRIQLLPGGGIRAENIVEILQKTHCTEAHLAPTLPHLAPPVPRNGIDYGGYRVIDRDAVAKAVEAVGGRRDSARA